MFYKAVMAFGVLALMWSVTWLYRILAGLEHIQGTDVMPLVVGGIAGVLSAWYFVPWLFKYEADRRQAELRRRLGIALLDRGEHLRHVIHRGSPRDVR